MSSTSENNNWKTRFRFNLAAEEGAVNYFYLDTVGKLTIGKGICLTEQKWRLLERDVCFYKKDDKSKTEVTPFELVRREAESLLGLVKNRINVRNEQITKENEKLDESKKKKLVGLSSYSARWYEQSTIYRCDLHELEPLMDPMVEEFIRMASNAYKQAINQIKRESNGNFNIKYPEWEDLPSSAKILLTDFAYNAGSFKNKKGSWQVMRGSGTNDESYSRYDLISHIASGNWDEAIRVSKRYAKGQPLTKRNNYSKELLNECKTSQ